ncbi:MAG TPA: DUF2891 domain-containing protein [Streptosporangiaceae bacterium]|nr:DUF2891 domain-containing protein [Streptosporangiaceae bacterium]
MTSEGNVIVTGATPWHEILASHAAVYVRVAIANIGREFPNGINHVMAGPGDFPVRPAGRNPVFYGSYDWHSCVEMHWLLIRLLRIAPQAVPGEEIRATLDRQFAADGLAAEAAYVAGPDSPGRYGWGWALALVHEAAALDDPDGRRWSAAMAPLADTVTDRFLRWLPKATYPVRYGVHPNTAFALSRSLPQALDRAAAGDRRLADAIAATARRWYGADADYPAAWEPSGADFLSPALTEAELMASLLPAEEFAAWLAAFLPGIADGRPASLFTPAEVSDSSDGQIAHLHGLNASRAWCWRRLAESLPAGDERIGSALAAARLHADAALPHVVGDHYMVEHWLAAYAVLLLS